MLLITAGLDTSPHAQLWRPFAAHGASTHRHGGVPARTCKAPRSVHLVLL